MWCRQGVMDALTGCTTAKRCDSARSMPTTRRRGWKDGRHANTELLAALPPLPGFRPPRRSSLTAQPRQGTLQDRQEEMRNEHGNTADDSDESSLPQDGGKRKSSDSTSDSKSNYNGRCKRSSHGSGQPAKSKRQAQQATATSYDYHKDLSREKGISAQLCEHECQDVASELLWHGWRACWATQWSTSRTSEPARVREEEN